MRNSIAAVLLVWFSSFPLLAAPGDWLAWRGPSANGIAASGQKPVTSWSTTKNVLWKRDIPGRGHSSPVVVGDLVVLTTADESAGTQSVVAVRRQNGEPAWEKVIHRGGLAKDIHKKNTHATPTLASDGEVIVATFCNEDSVKITVLTLGGDVVWQKSAGRFDPKLYLFGYAPSPLLYRGTVIVSSDFEKGFLAAFQLRDGNEVWRTPRVSKHVSYSSPIVARVAGRDQLLISGRDRVSSYDPATGKSLWSTPGTTNATCGTMIWDKDLVFASGGYPKKETIAVRADGSKEVVWKNNQKCYEQSMLIHDGYIYAFNDNGIAICWRAKDGQEMWKQRLQGPVSASPILAGGNIYASNERGKTFVFKATPKGFESVSTNQLGDESFATPAICDDRIYLRHASRKGKQRQETLYCIGKK